MTESDGGTTRRSAMMKIGLLLNGIVGAILAVPVVRFILSPASHARRGAYSAWTPLGDVHEFPANETRLATYRNPIANVWDGATADIACWVRNIDGQKFQVFASNCAHLGCPVRWFPQAHLFMCPCHGGAYYQDGSRASGPPDRGLFELDYKLEGDKLWIKTGELPTPGGNEAKLHSIGPNRCA
jgi:menaquinol-cytochrome c reductase iron-sulfur subunit